MVFQRLRTVKHVALEGGRLIKRWCLGSEQAKLRSRRKRKFWRPIMQLGETSVMINVKGMCYDFHVLIIFEHTDVNLVRNEIGKDLGELLFWRYWFCVDFPVMQRLKGVFGCLMCPFTLVWALFENWFLWCLLKRAVRSFVWVHYQSFLFSLWCEPKFAVTKFS